MNLSWVLEESLKYIKEKISLMKFKPMLLPDFQSSAFGIPYTNDMLIINV